MDGLVSRTSISSSPNASLEATRANLRRSRAVVIVDLTDDEGEDSTCGAAPSDEVLGKPDAGTVTVETAQAFESKGVSVVEEAITFLARVEPVADGHMESVKPFSLLKQPGTAASDAFQTQIQSAASTESGHVTLLKTPSTSVEPGVLRGSSAKSRSKSVPRNLSSQLPTRKSPQLHGTSSSSGLHVLGEEAQVPTNPEGGSEPYIPQLVEESSSLVFSSQLGREANRPELSPTGAHTNHVDLPGAA